ncbi:GNAT family N-acetyltransferase [Bacillus mangrovi]|uniref:GNAT family N-acetyltransferase n=1 Tax=Metabacillus mangrovi TaxID=1491830 RepID=A0A7X2S4G0_9BACI|nr:GNAT family N-acetyltransferase [Metabacillus mangrovi]MTH53063.1 GNAT family N-acetyltransferase [Metabacillus mangrovi]
MIDIQAYYDIDFFKKAALPFLEMREAENNLALGILLDKQSSSLQPVHMSIIRKDGSIIAVLLQTHPKQVIVSALPDLEEEDLFIAGKRIAQIYRSVPGLIGEKRTAEALAGRIASLTGRKPRVVMEQRLHLLSRVEPSSAPVNGTLVQLTAEHRALVSQWVYDFCTEAEETATMFEADEKADEMIRKKSLFGWKAEGEIVSMANRARPTATNVMVNYVYTPPVHRKKGYATQCVTALTESLLAEGYKTTSLFTDLSNPTSNKIYKEIGYKPIEDGVKVQFLEIPKKPAK